MPSVNDSLRSSIARVKSSTQSSPQKFAFFAGGQKALIINPNAKILGDAKRETGSSSSITGTCYFEDGIFIFETLGAPPAVLGSAIKTCITKFAGTTVRVETRKAGSADESEAHESQADDAGTKGPKTKVSGSSSTVKARKPSSPDEEESDESEAEEAALKIRKTKISTRVKALQDKLTSLASSAPQKVIPIRIKITQAGEAFKKARLDESEQRLEEAEELL